MPSDKKLFVRMSLEENNKKIPIYTYKSGELQSHYTSKELLAVKRNIEKSSSIFLVIISLWNLVKHVLK